MTQDIAPFAGRSWTRGDARLAFTRPAFIVAAVVFLSLSGRLAAAPGLVFNFSSCDGPLQPVSAPSVTGEDAGALLLIRNWAGVQWSRVRPRSVLPAQIEARRRLLAEEAELLYAFTTNYPASLWTPALQLNLGRHYRRTGRYSRALQLWRAAWESTKDFPGGAAREIADATLGHYAELLSSLGRYETLTPLFAGTEGRVLPFASDAQYYLRALEAYSHMGLNPGKSYRCGTYALGRVARTLHATNSVAAALGRVPSPAGGFTLRQLSDLAAAAGLRMVPAHWDRDRELVVPSVIHWKENHYAAIIEQHGNWYKVADPTFDDHPVMLRYEDIIAEASGYFLVPESLFPARWRPADPAECESICGRGYVTVVGDHHDEPGCPFGSGPPGVRGPAPANSGGGAGCNGGCGGSKAQVGLPFWSVSEPNINLWIFDTPLEYQPSVGPPVAVRLLWRQRGLEIWRGTDVDPFTDFGGGWSSPCRAAIGPVSFDDSGYAVAGMHLGSGAYLSVEFSNWATTSEPSYFNNTKLQRVIDPVTQEETSYLVQYPDGSSDVYGFIATNSFGYVRRFVLSAKVDAQGHQTRIDYIDYNPDLGQALVKQIVDPDQHALAFSYLSLDLGYRVKSNLVERITDWTGRTVRFKYDPGLLTLSEIVDAAGITNRFEYDLSNWISRMVTPYGSTRFDHFQVRANHGETRYLTVIEPNGARQRYWFESADAGVPDPLDPPGAGYPRPGVAPDPFASWLTDRNSYHWDARSFDSLSVPFQVDPRLNPPTAADRLSARGRHWLGTQLEGGADTHTLGAERDRSPEGNRAGQVTWFSYPGQEDPDFSGSQILPAMVARVMPDGTTWSEQFTYNDFGLVTAKTEKWTENGQDHQRSHTFTYDANGVDLLSHRGPGGVLVAGFGYDPGHLHLPARRTNALNEVTYYDYDSRNRLIAVQTPSDLRTTHTYGADGYLKTSVDALGLTPFRTNRFTYLDNHLRTHTDERGLTVTNTYDNLGRLVRVDYPDGTFEEDHKHPIRGEI